MYLCYIDKSGTAHIPGNTSHYVLTGISIPVWHWHTCDKDINDIKQKYGLVEMEIHVAWMMREYREQHKITDFKSMDNSQRRYEVEKIRKTQLLAFQQAGSSKKNQYHQTRKNFRKTNAYIHLTHEERRNCVSEIAKCVSSWGFARLFAECIDKIHFDPAMATLTVDEQAFEQVVSRFEHHLRNMDSRTENKLFGLLIHDNNETVSAQHTQMMKQFHKKGTFFNRIDHIIETPLFVDSELTSMVQIADLCSYALRRYLEKGEEDLFDLVFSRAERKDGRVVSVRHFSDESCSCKICDAH